MAERHIFGSYRGYTTLARSPGVNDDDIRVLESGIFSFGQTYDLAFYQSLPRSTPFFTTSLPDDRRALTCVGLGKKDDAGRPTLLFYSAVLSQGAWDDVLLGDVAILMQSAPLWTWSGQEELATVELPDEPSRAIISRSQVPRLLAVISQIERADLGGQAVVVRESPFAFRDARAMEMLIPVIDRPRFTTVFRALSPQMPTKLICLAKESTAYEDVPAIDESVEQSAYAKALVEAAFASGVIPTALVRKYCL